MRGLAPDQFVDIAGRTLGPDFVGLSQGQVRKRFIRTRGLNEGFYFAPLDTAAAVVAFDTPMLLALQGVNRTAVI